LGGSELTKDSNFGEATRPRRSAVVWSSSAARAGELAALATLSDCIVVEDGHAREADFLLVDLAPKPTGLRIPYPK